ncbi:WYL domain-containing protein [Metabacillus arenae]|uniref:WYL domain-containing protein n=1 Tax=Metabacillus arenae TaxID=2771434 RepID=A0A926NSU0_9BACI|nr:hypothetical protein [Metabacillus arenae]MBD1383286.1 hypothetical protein [Metabacillus arenae]
MDLLTKAFAEQKPLEIVYLAKDSQLSQRVIFIKQMNNHSILAYCCLKKEYRRFMINQILAIKIKNFSN